MSAQTNVPVENVHVFIERNVSLGSDLAKTVLPTLMMGSRQGKEKTVVDERLLLEVWTNKASFTSADIAEDDLNSERQKANSSDGV